MAIRGCSEFFVCFLGLKLVKYPPMSKEVIGTYDCYVGLHQVQNPALQRQIQFSREPDGYVQAKYLRLADGSCEVIPLENIRIQDHSTKQKQQLLAKGANMADVLTTSVFSELASDRQEEIAREVGDAQKWDVSITWVQNADCHIATQSKLESVASLELIPY